MAVTSPSVELRKALFYHKLPAEIDNRISEFVAEDEDLSSTVRTFWSLSLTSRDFHEQFNAFLYQSHELVIREKSRQRREKPRQHRSSREDDMTPSGSAMETVAKTGNVRTFYLVLKYAPGLCKLKHIGLALEHGHVQIAERLFELETMPAKLIKRKGSPRNPIVAAVKLGLTHLVSHMLDTYGPLSPSFPALGYSSILSMACEMGHVDLVRHLIEQDPSPVWAVTRGDDRDAVSTALNEVMVRDEAMDEFLGVCVWVGRAGLYDVAKQILNSRPQLAQQHWRLFAAVLSGQQEMFDLLLNHGAQVPTEQIQVDGLLHQAICGGSVPLVRTLLAHGADARSICLPTNAGDRLSAIQCAALSKAFHRLPTSVPVVEELLKHGATIGTPVASTLSDNIKEKSPLRIAIEVNDIELVEYLLNLNAHMAEGEHGLLSSVRSVEMLEHFQQLGMDINGYYYGEDDNRCRYLPIIGVARNSQGSPLDEGDIFRYFVERVADINATNASGKTVLHHCYEVVDKYNRYTLARISHLLDKGANLFLADGAGRTPFHTAVRHGTPDTLRLLRERGADVHAKDLEGRTPLHHLWETERHKLTHYSKDLLDMLRNLEFLLLECMSDPDAQAEDGIYAVHIPGRTDFTPSIIGHILDVYAHARFPDQCASLFEPYETCRGCRGRDNRHKNSLTLDQAREILNRHDTRGQLFLVQRCTRESLEYTVERDLSHFINLGMDVKQVERGGQTVLLTPLAWQNPRIREICIREGADMNHMNDDGNTMLDLMQAYSTEFPEPLESSVDNDINLSRQDQDIKELRQRGARWGWEIRGDAPPQV